MRHIPPSHVYFRAGIGKLPILSVLNRLRTSDGRQPRSNGNPGILGADPCPLLPEESVPDRPAARATVEVDLGPRGPCPSRPSYPVVHWKETRQRRPPQSKEIVCLPVPVLFLHSPSQRFLSNTSWQWAGVVPPGRSSQSAASLRMVTMRCRHCPRPRRAGLDSSSSTMSINGRFPGQASGDAQAFAAKLIGTDRSRSAAHATTRASG